MEEIHFHNLMVNSRRSFATNAASQSGYSNGIAPAKVELQWYVCGLAHAHKR